MDLLSFVSIFNVAIYVFFCVLFLLLFFYLLFYVADLSNENNGNNIERKISIASTSETSNKNSNDKVTLSITPSYSSRNEVTVTNPWVDTVRAAFDEQMYREIGIGLLSPLTVSVYKRWRESDYIVEINNEEASGDNADESTVTLDSINNGGDETKSDVNNSAAVVGLFPDAGKIVASMNADAVSNFREVLPTSESSTVALMDRAFYNYPERLIVVQPQNWIVYTNNGINFYYLSNNVSISSSRCDPGTSVSAIEFRLLTLDETYDLSGTGRADKSGRLKIACINYSFDQLIRIFGSSADKSVYDFSDLFDQTKVSDPPKVTVDEVLDILIQNSIV